jgi:hypothetical protein
MLILACIHKGSINSDVIRLSRHHQAQPGGVYNFIIISIRLATLVCVRCELFDSASAQFDNQLLLMSLYRHFTFVHVSCEHEISFNSSGCNHQLETG